MGARITPAAQGDYEAPACSLEPPTDFVKTAGASELDAAFDGAVRAQAVGAIIAKGPVLTANQLRIT